MPESPRKIQVRAAMLESGSVLVKKATSQAKTRITTVRMAVARLEFTCATPTLASTAVSPAKNADSKAQTNQLISFSRGKGFAAVPRFPPILGEVGFYRFLIAFFRTMWVDAFDVRL